MERALIILAFVVLGIPALFYSLWFAHRVLARGCIA